MRHYLLFFVLTLGGLICFIGYYYALTDWINDCKTGVYARNGIEAIIETIALIGYTYLAIRFTRNKMSIH